MITIVTFLVLSLLAKYTLDRQIIGYNVIGETCILAGGFSNFIDRLLNRGVVDFIKVSLWGKSFPLFNVADIAITIGAGIVLYYYFFDND